MLYLDCRHKTRLLLRIYVNIVNSKILNLFLNPVFCSLECSSIYLRPKTIIFIAFVMGFFELSIIIWSGHCSWTRCTPNSDIQFFCSELLKDVEKKKRPTSMPGRKFCHNFQPSLRIFSKKINFRSSVLEAKSFLGTCSSTMWQDKHRAWYSGGKIEHWAWYSWGKFKNRGCYSWEK